MTLKVLLVEDIFIAQIVAKKQMMAQDCEVDVAENAETAIFHAQQSRYDVILMDIGLGEGMDGFEVTAHIKQYCPLNQETIIIALSAHAGNDYLEKAKEVGMLNYFNKPFRSEDAKAIVDFVKETLQSSSL